MILGADKFDTISPDHRGFIKGLNWQKEMKCVIQKGNIFVNCSLLNFTRFHIYKKE